MNNCPEFRIIDSFFDKIAVADIERIHSAVIGWLFSNDCHALDNQQKIMIINQLFQTNVSFSEPILQSVNEYQHTDIFIEISDMSDNCNKHCFIIENKIKSPQHDDQLERYKNEHNKNNTHFLYLSLIKDKSVPDAWKSATYSNLLELLERSMDGVMSKDKDYVILKEYCQTLGNLCYAIEQFSSSPEKYPNVFLDGNLKKSQKKCVSFDSDVSHYIYKNNLETIFQKLYYQDVVESMSVNLVETPYWISETRGNAEIGFCLRRIKCEEINKDFNIDFAIQRGTCKLSVSIDYYNVKKGKQNLEILRRTWGIILLENNGKYGYKENINKPKKDKRARLSISKKIEGWNKMTKEQFVNTVITELNNAKELTKEWCLKYYSRFS